MGNTKTTPAVLQHPGAGPQESECAVDNPSVAQSPAPITLDDLERLVSAAREALALLDRIDQHAPEGLAFGGESKVRRKLREAVRRCSFEVRPCEFCDGGMTHATPRHPQERPRLIPCPECRGSGKRRVFTYGLPKGLRR